MNTHLDEGCQTHPMQCSPLAYTSAQCVPATSTSGSDRILRLAALVERGLELWNCVSTSSVPTIAVEVVVVMERRLRP